MRAIAPFVVVFSVGCTLINDPATHMGQLQDTPDDGAMVLYDDFCDEYARLACDAFDDCCTTAPVPPDCVATLTGACDLYGQELWRDARTGYDARASAGMLAEGRRLASTCDVSIVDWSRRVYPTVLDGIRPPGTECTPEPRDGGFDYAALLSCDGADNACIFGGIDRWTCQPRVAAGGGCFLSEDCVAGLYCDTMRTGMPGTCAPQLAIGAPCAPNRDGCRDVCICDTPACATATCRALAAEVIYCNLFTQVE